MVMTYEQWQLILGLIDEKEDLSENNIIEKIRELLKKVRIIEPKETSRMLEEISHKLETSSKIPRVQETQEPLKKRLKVVNVPQTPEEAEKILKETGVSNAQKMIKRVLKRLGVRETSGKSKAVVLEDVLDARKISEKVPAMLDARRMLETLGVLKRASENVYREWEKAKFDVNHWFEVDCLYGRCPYMLLYLANDFKLKNVFSALLKVKGININVKGPFSQWTALRWATENEDAKVVSELIDNGANVDSQDSFGQTPLYSGSINGNIKIIKSLVQNGADVNKEDITKSNPLFKASKNNNTEAVKYLMDNGAKVKPSEKCKQTPLHAAIRNHNRKMLDKIIRNDNDIDNDIDVVDANGKSALYYTTEEGVMSLLELLLKQNADINLEDNFIGRTPLQIAVINGLTEVVKFLIYHNADVNQKDANGWTAFNYAAAKNNKAQEILLKHGANIETKDIQKILSFIYSHNYFEAMNGIVEFGIHKYLTELMGVYVLHCAATHGCIKNIHILKERYGVNVNASNDLGLTALHYAAIYGHTKVIDVLYNYQAGMNPSDDLRSTPLHYAAKHGHEKAVRTLLNHRASIWVCDICGERAIDLAKNDNVRRILEEAEKTERENARIHGVIIESDEPNTALDMVEGQIADNLSHMQLEPSTEVRPTRIDGTKERRAHSPYRWTYRKRKLSTEMDSGSSTETDECNDKWSYGESSRATAVWKYDLFNR